MGRGGLVCDIYHMEIPRVSLEALKALEGSAPPISFTTEVPPFGSGVGVGIHLRSKRLVSSGVRTRAESFFQHSLRCECLPKSEPESGCS